MFSLAILLSGVPAHAAPYVVTSVKTLSAGLQSEAAALPGGIALPFDKLLSLSISLADDEVILYDVGTGQLFHWSNTTPTDVLLSRQPETAYLSSYIPELGGGYTRPHANQIASGALDQPGVYLVINAQAYQVPSVDLNTLDSDFDGLSDYQEMSFGDADASSYVAGVDINPLNADTDGDGLLDGDEVNIYGSFPLFGDSDGDGLSDGDEVNQYGTNPIEPDSDFDGDTDAEEIAFGTDPNDPLDNKDAHRPFQPVLVDLLGLQPINNLVVNAQPFNDPDITEGDYLAADQWQISTDAAYATLILDRERIDTEMTDAGMTFPVSDGLLALSTDYWVRLRQRDASGLWSDWSVGLMFSTQSTDADDSDNDGITDIYQVAGYTDTNLDGIEDATQGIRAIYDAEQGAVIGVGYSGPDNAVVATLSSIPLSALDGVLVPPGQTPYGLFRFRVDMPSGYVVDPNNPATIPIEIHFPVLIPGDAQWFKLDPSTRQLIDFSSSVTANGNTATIYLSDGALGDFDGLINGSFLDPIGLWLPGVDTDGDTVVDSADNCINVPNTDQRDTDGDDYGNRCDADLDNSGSVSFGDLNLFRDRFGSNDPDADFDGSGSVSFGDLNIFRELFGKPPGPSGLVP